MLIKIDGDQLTLDEFFRVAKMKTRVELSETAITKSNIPGKSWNNS
jgi:hypothetical protein